MLLKTLTPKCLELLRHLHRNPAVSVYAFAKALNRPYANVHSHVEALALAFLIERNDARLRVDYGKLTVHCTFAM